MQVTLVYHCFTDVEAEWSRILDNLREFCQLPVLLNLDGNTKAPLDSPYPVVNCPVASVCQYVETEYYVAINNFTLLTAPVIEELFFHEGQPVYLEVPSDLSRFPPDFYPKLHGHTQATSTECVPRARQWPYRTLIHPGSVVDLTSFMNYDPRSMYDSHYPFFLLAAEPNTIAPEAIFEILQSLPTSTKEVKTKPLISCLMVTRNRLSQVRTAVSCFQRQTYPNLELIVVDDGEDETTAYLTGLQDPRIRVLHPGTDICMSLPELHSLAVRVARGEYCVEWEDENYYQATYLSVLYTELLRKKAEVIFLGRVTMVWPDKGYYTISRYREEGWSNSMLARRELLPLRSTKHCVINSSSYAVLLQCNIHGESTWHEEHLRKLFVNTQPLASIFHESLLRLHTGCCLRASKEPSECQGLTSIIDTPTATESTFLGWIVLGLFLLALLLCCLPLLGFTSNQWLQWLAYVLFIVALVIWVVGFIYK